MSRLKYIAKEEGIRRVNPSLDSTSYDSEYDFPVAEDTVEWMAEMAESRFERRAREFVSTQVTERHEGIERDWGWTVYLDEQNVLDFDPNEGDTFEIRNGPDGDDWLDITDDVVLDPERGIVEIQRRVLTSSSRIFSLEDTNQRFRVTYRYGIDGKESGATTLEQSIASGDSTPITADVADASTIPVGEVVLINGEYFYVSGRDTVSSQNTLTLDERAIRGTGAEAHSSGDTVGFVEDDIREAIASRVAYSIIQSDGMTDILAESENAIDPETWMEQLDAEFEETAKRYSTGTAGYV